jgi:hypothetical protein
MNKTLGSMFFHTATSSDKRFNLMRRGDRYRLTTISDVNEDGTLQPGILEIFCDTLSFCHKFLFSEDIKNAGENYFTLGLENLILLKTQFIKRVSKSEISKENEYRIMSEFGKREFVIGMEDKDMRDVAGAFFDHEIGNGNDCIDPDKLGSKLNEDWGLWRTCTLNLGNMRRNLDIVAKKFDMKKEHVGIIRERLETILDALDNRYKAKKPMFASPSKQWWQDVEEQSR